MKRLASMQGGPYTPGTPKAAQQEASQRLGRLLAEALASGKLERKAVDDAIGGLPELDNTELYYIAGRFLELRGEKKEAVPYFKASVRTLKQDNPGALAACERLRALGVDPQEK